MGRSKNPVENALVQYSDDESIYEDSEKEEEEDEEEVIEESETDDCPPPPQPSKQTALRNKRPTNATRPTLAKKVKKSENVQDEGKKVEKGKKRFEVSSPKVPKLTIKRKEAKSDFEIQPMENFNKAKVRDMSTKNKFPKEKIILDDRTFMRVATVRQKSKGTSFDQLMIGREATANADGTLSKPFHMLLPIRCIEPMWRGISFLIGREVDNL